jgi:tRNA(Ile)-lysidine synthase
MSSHPATLLTLVRRSLEKECALPERARLGVAVSGGPDSMALLDALSTLRQELGLELLALGVDHGLREAAHAELDLAEGHARARDVPFTRLSLALEDGPNLQERAREARYAALLSALDAALGPEALLATGHHQGDRAETVLLRLLRGTSLAGLAVLPPRQGRRLRPMIRASREAVLSHCQRHGVPFAEDPSNGDARFLRARVRAEVLPLLRSLSPGIEAALAELAEEACQGEGGLGLNREQRRQLRRARADRSLGLDLPLGDGLSLVRGGRSGRK